MASPAHWPSRATPRREEEAGVPLRVLRLRAHHIATFKPGGESEGADEDADGAGGRASSGEPFALDAGATLQQLLAAVASAWARSGAAPLSSPLREAYTVAGERITRVSALQDGDDVVFATFSDLRPVLCDDLAMVFTDESGARSELAAARRLKMVVPPAAHRRRCSASAPLEVKIRSNIIALLDINTVQQTFTCHFFLDATWVDTGLAGDELKLDGPQTVNVGLSDQKRGWLVTNEDNKHYYFTPQLRFRNLVSRLSLLEEEYHVSYDDLAFERTSSSSVSPSVAAGVAHGPARVVYRLSGTATFHTLFGLRNFPLDSQTFAVEIMSSWDKAHVRLVRNTDLMARSVISRDTFSLSSEYDLSGQVHLINRESNPKHSSSMTTYSYIEIQMHVRRRLSFWVWNVWLPLFNVTGLCFGSFLVETTQTAARLSITLTILLTLVSYRFSIMSKLPKIDYLTRLDQFFQLCFGVVFAVTCEAVIVAYLAEVDLASELQQNWQQPSAWEVYSRQALFWVSISWASLNAAVLLAVIVARRVQLSTDALHWWDERVNVLWIGPVDPRMASAMSVPMLQRAIDNAASRRRQRPTTPPQPGVPDDEGGKEDEPEDVARAPYAIRVASLRVVTPGELQELKERRPGLIPRTRQPFLLLETGTQAQALEALKLLVESEAADAAARGTELAAANANPALAAPARTVLPRRASMMLRAVQSKSVIEGGGFGGGPPATLEELIRWMRLEDRRISVEPSLPEYKHLLVRRDPRHASPMSFRWLVAVLWHVFSPRSSSAAARRDFKVPLAGGVRYRQGTTQRVGEREATARDGRKSTRQSIVTLVRDSLARMSAGSARSSTRAGTPERPRGRPTHVMLPGAMASDDSMPMPPNASLP